MQSKSKIRTQAITLQQTTRPVRSTGMAWTPVPVQFRRGRVPALFRREGRGFAVCGSSRSPGRATLSANRCRRDGGGRRNRLCPFQCLRALHPGHVLHWPVRARIDWAGAGPGPGSQERKVVKRRGNNSRPHLEPRIKVQSGWVIRGVRRGWSLSLREEICLSFRVGDKY